MAYNPTVYVNDNPPALNADNLNKMENGIFNATETADGAKSAVEAVINGQTAYLDQSFNFTNGTRIYKNGDKLSVYGQDAHYGYTDFIPLTVGKPYVISAQTGIKYYYYITDADELNETMNHVQYPVSGWATGNTNVVPEYGFMCISYYTEDNSDLPSGYKAVSVTAKKDVLYAFESELITDIFPQSAFEQGTIASNGINSANNYRIRTKDIYKATIDFSVSNKSGYTVAVFYYRENGAFISWSGFPASDAALTYNIHAGECVRFVVSKYPLAITTVADYVGLVCQTIYKTDLLAGDVKAINDELDAKYDADLKKVKDCAEFAKLERLTYYGHPYYVGSDKEFHTINDALAQWEEDNYPEAVVFIDNGEYNETISVEDKTIAFIGESKEGTIIRTKTGNYTYPPFKIHHGNVYVANLTAIADHSGDPSFVYDTTKIYAYAFHIDGGNVGGCVYVKNCRAISHQSAAFGMGTIPNSKIRLENVDSYSYTDANAGHSLELGSILLHTASSTTYPTPGTEDLEMIDVKAYAENTTDVITFNNSNSTNPLGIKAIKVIAIDGDGSDRNSLVHLPNYYTLNADSCGNSYDKLNY